MLKVKLLHANAKVPTLATDGSVGYDLYTIEGGIISQSEPTIVRTGLAMAVPTGYGGFIWPRSGLAVRYGVDRRAGVVDNDFRGEVMAVLQSTVTKHYHYEAGERIAQIVIMPVYRPNVMVVDDLDATVRGERGFGSTGNKPQPKQTARLENWYTTGITGSARLAGDVYDHPWFPDGYPVLALAEDVADMAPEVRNQLRAIAARLKSPPAQGPEFSDGCDSEGFLGGCERSGHTVETCLNKPAQEDDKYAELEREHLGDPDKQTGIYHPEHRIGSWLSAALEDPNACEEFKADINAWFEYRRSLPAQEGEPVGYLGHFGEVWLESKVKTLQVDHQAAYRELPALYLHAPNDRLRKAAEAFVKAYKPGWDHHGMNEYNDLRAALEGGFMSDFEFQIGDRVEKYTGDYKLEGVVIMRGYTVDGKPRYVVEHRPLTPGLLHIYGPNNLRKL